MKVIELGVRKGNSTYGWLYGLEKYGGHLWSVDISNAGIPGPHPHWTFIEGDDMSADVLAQLPDTVDVVFIDSSHEFEHTKQELESYSQRVRSGGRIVLHDTALPHENLPEGEQDDPVLRAVQWFTETRGYPVTYWANCNGLASIEVT